MNLELDLNQSSFDLGEKISRDILKFLAEQKNINYNCKYVRYNSRIECEVTIYLPETQGIIISIFCEKNEPSYDYIKIIRTKHGSYHSLKYPAYLIIKQFDDGKCGIIKEQYCIKDKMYSKVEWFIEKAKLQVEESE